MGTGNSDSFSRSFLRWACIVSLWGAVIGAKKRSPKTLATSLVRCFRVERVLFERTFSAFSFFEGRAATVGPFQDPFHPPCASMRFDMPRGPAEKTACRLWAPLASRSLRALAKPSAAAQVNGGPLEETPPSSERRGDHDKGARGRADKPRGKKGSRWEPSVQRGARSVLPVF